MRKKVLLLLAAIFISFTSMSSMAFADEKEPDDSFTCSKGGFFSKDFNDEVERYKEDDANMGEKFMTSQLQNLWNIGDINGLSTLVFGNPYCVWADGSSNFDGVKMSSDGIFTVDEREKILNPALKLFSGVYVFLMVLSMMISSVKLGLSSVRGQGISDFVEDGKMWFFSLFFIIGYGTITNIIFEMNAAVVIGFKELLETQGVKADSFSIMASWSDLTGVSSEGVTGIPILSLIIVVLAEWILAIVLNFVYIARKVVVLVLLILGYVAAYSLMFTRTRAFFGTWMRELIGNVFLQSIHALLLFGMAMFASMGANTIYKLGLMMMFIPLTGMISKWLKIGDSSSKVGSAMTMMGLGGVMSMMALTNQAGNVIRGGSMNGGSMFSNSSASNNSDFGGISLSAAGGGSDASITSITTDASGSNSASWMSAKNNLSNIGGKVFGAAGMVAGPAGAMAGAKLGQAVTSNLVQIPRNMVSGANSAFNTMSAAANYSDGAGNTGFKAMISNFKEMNANLGDRRAFYGNMGESLGAMVGFGAAGRNIGLAMSGVSRQRLAATSVADGGRGMTDASGNVIPTSMASLAQQYPGANMQFVQSNRGSSMWVQSPNQDWKQVGQTGAADPSLKNGEVRAMDYSFTKPSSSYELQSNGSYKSVMNNASFGAGNSSLLGSSQNVMQTSSAGAGAVGFDGITTTTGSGAGESSRPELAGLPGSTPNVMRTSNAYTVGVGGDGTITSGTLNAVNSSNAVRLTDARFRSDSINPDAFVAHNVPGVENRNTGDRVADSVDSLQQTASQVKTNVSKSWSQASKAGKNERNTRIS